jgi:hypothetical protein
MILLRYPQPQVDDIVDFIGAPWASALFHDKFPAFRSALVGMVQQAVRGSVATPLPAMQKLRIVMLWKRGTESGP